MSRELDRARKELERYVGNEVPVADAVSIMERATGLRIHLLATDEVPRALAHAKERLKNEKVREGPFGPKNEIVKALEENWAGLSGEARSLVGTLWAPQVNADMVVTTVDSVQPKEKILGMIENILRQKERASVALKGEKRRRDSPASPFFH